MTNKPNKAPLSAAEIAEKLEAARRSPRPAAALLQVAEAMSANPVLEGRAEEIRFAAKRLEADPFDDVAVLTISTRIDDFKRAAFRDSLVWNPVNDPLTVPHNLTFPLARGQTPTDAKPTQSKLSGRADYYLKRAAMTPEELEAHDAANTEYAARVARETAERYFR
ncbi:hypothetical protein I6G56_11730 [Burkholderia humptydooensis]|uniref:Uncharacterized protein n=1 Tax=Burkholderia humptydooensis TaxID=430531 RepID=A0A7U4P3V1_9BURK|nr:MULTISPECIES: hypothetical protein [Burkholderia]AJY42692.1 hypothetical protein BW21_1865 [Burkholderia sp. 2002721687]ALX42489.1 hypothetical protein AQ610_08700 [Burkholderia humptydooensis]QPS42298.1 hypothetical protein I6G56_11730 [Burkholderia humptydooensis]